MSLVVFDVLKYTCVYKCQQGILCGLNLLACVPGIMGMQCVSVLEWDNLLK